MTKRTPLEEFERFLERMRQQFEETSRQWESEEFFGRLGLEPMAVDLAERDGEFVATVELPGFDRDEIDLEVTDRTIRIGAEREDAEEREAERYVRRERRHESMRRTIHLPQEIDTSKVTAEMNNGVLTVTLPKREGGSARRIEIGSK